MTEKWTDGRLDEFEKRVDERFDRVDERFDDVSHDIKQIDERFDQLEAHLKKIDGRIEAVQQDAIDRHLSQNRMMVFAVLALSSAYMAGFAALVTQI